MADIGIEYLDDVYVKVRTDSGIAQELSDYFTFNVPGAKFMPSYRNKMWDGKIRLFNTVTCTLYAGLRYYIEVFAKERDYEIEYLSDFSTEEFSLVEAKDWVEKQLKPKLTPRNYQYNAFTHAIRNKRAMLLSPTASGKSFIIYLITRWLGSRTLIIVPTTSLVHQLSSDFVDYGFKSDKYVHKIYSGQDKVTDKPVVITTWQSIYKQPKKWFDQFDVVIGDEAHLFKAKSLTSIMSKLTDCKYRYGFTGTLDGTQTHKLVLEGLFGPVKKVTTTADLIEAKQLADFKIKCLVLSYSEEMRKLISKSTYQEELDFITRNSQRNKFIKNLALSLEGNTLILFQFVEKHGKELYDIIKDSGLPTHFVHGGVDGAAREDIRAIVESSDNSIIVASYGTFSTGVNIRNLHNVVFASPSKSRIRNLQSIGRGLRTSETKTKATLYDIADDLTWKSKRNHTIIHFEERVKIYNEEKFPYKIYTVGIKD